MHITSIDSKQAAKIAALMGLVAVMAATWPLAGAAWAFSVHLPPKHFAVLLFVPFFYAVAIYFLADLACGLYNFAARVVGGLRLEIAHHTPATAAENPEKPAPIRKVA